MRLFLTDSFKSDYQNLPGEIKSKLDRQLNMLLADPRYPSLQTKKMKGLPYFEARITQNYRFIFRIQGDIYVIMRAGLHDILNRPWSF